MFVTAAILSGLMDKDGVSDLFASRFAMLVFDMPLTIGFGSEAEIANGTFKWFFTGMRSHMPSQCALVIAAVSAITDVANVGRPVHVLLIVSL